MEKETKKRRICVILGIVIAAVLTTCLSWWRMDLVKAEEIKLQEGIAEEVFRFHVLAQSDSEEDQNVKLKVRDAVLAYMKTDLGDAASAGETKSWARAHLTDIEETADRVLEEAGCDYRSKAEVTTCYFPEKRYGDVIFPEGEYEALRICLGQAQGHNWWCVLYPNLCFIDTACAVVSEEGKEELKTVLDEEEYELVTATADFKIKWFFFGDDTKDK